MTRPAHTAPKVTPAAPVGNARGRTSKREILEAASALFGEVGFHEASLRDIAGRVNMSHPGLLHHFPTKKALLGEVLAYRDEQDLAAMQAILRSDQVEYDYALVRVAHWNSSRPGVVALFATLSAEATSEDHPAHSYFVERYTKLLTDLTGLYTGLKEAGQLRDNVEPQVAAKTVLALMDGLQIQWLLALASNSPDLEVDMSYMVEQYIVGLRK